MPIKKYIYYIWHTEWELMDSINIGIGSVAYEEPRTHEIAVVASSEQEAVLFWRWFTGYRIYENDGNVACLDYEPHGVIKIMVSDDPIGKVIKPKSDHPACVIIQDCTEIPSVNRFYAWRNSEPLWVKSTKDKARYIVVTDNEMLHADESGNFTTTRISPATVKKLRGDAYVMIAHKMRSAANWSEYSNGTESINYSICEVHFAPDGGMFSLLVKHGEPLDSERRKNAMDLGLYFPAATTKE